MAGACRRCWRRFKWGAMRLGRPQKKHTTFAASAAAGQSSAAIQGLTEPLDHGRQALPRGPRNAAAWVSSPVGPATQHLPAPARPGAMWTLLIQE